MAYGLQALNANGEFLLTDEYVKPWFMAKATASSLNGPTPIDFRESTDGTNYPQKNFNRYTINYTVPNHNGVVKSGFAAITMPNTSIYYSPQVSWQSGSNFSIEVLVPTSITAVAADTPEVYLFCTENINSYATSGYGLQIFNSVPQCMYDSNKQAFRPIEAIPGYTPFAYLASPFDGLNPKFSSGTVSGNTVYDFSYYSISKPIFVLPQFTYFTIVWDDSGTPNYNVPANTPYWEYTFKTFYQRNSSNIISSKSYYIEVFNETEVLGVPAQQGGTFGNAQNYIIISDGNRYATTNGVNFPNATYSLSVNPASPAEGTNFTVTLTTTGIPNNTQYNWELTGNTLTAEDFSGATSGTLTITNNTASVVFSPLIDADSGTENYVFSILDVNGGIIKAISFNVTNTVGSATYTMSRTPASGNINEGDTFTVTVSTNYVQPGTVLNYTVSGLTASDGTNVSSNGSFPALTGTFQSASASKVFNTTADNTTDGNKTFTVTLSHGSNPSVSVVVTDSSQFPAQGTMVQLSTTTPTRNEGQSASVTATWQLGTYLTYDDRTFALRIASGSAATSSDATISPTAYGPLTRILNDEGEVVNIRKIWTVSIIDDLNTDSSNPETLTLEVVDADNRVYDTLSININDTSQTPKPSVSLYSVNPAQNEYTGNIDLDEVTTKTVQFTVDVTHTAVSTIYWRTVGSANVTVGDFDTAINGNFNSIVGNTQITLPDITVKRDYTTEVTQESFYLEFHNNSSYTDLLYTSPTVIIGDTSQTPTLNLSSVVVTPSPVNEGSSVSVTFTIQDNQVRPIYWKVVGGPNFTGDDVNNYAVNGTGNFQSATAAGESRTITIPLAADQSTESVDQETDFEYFYLYFFTAATWNSGSPVDSNRWGVIGPIYVKDTSLTPITRNLTTSKGSCDEGSSFVITYTSNDPAAQNYTISGVSSSDINGASLTGSISPGDQITYTVTNDLTTEGNETFTMTLDSYSSSYVSVTIVDTSKKPAPLSQTIDLNTLGQDVNPGVVSSNVYWVKFILSGSTTFVISTEHKTSNVDTVISLYNSSGDKISSDDDGGTDNVNFASNASRIQRTEPAGTYYVAIVEYNAANTFGTNGWNVTSSAGTFDTTNIKVSLWDVNNVPLPQVVSASVGASVNEGDSITPSITILDTLNRTLYWRVDYSGASSSDLSGTLTDSWFAGANAYFRHTKNVTITTASDSTTETGAESFRIQYSTQSNFSTIFYNTSYITINDTSQTPALPSWSFGTPPGNLSEGVTYSIAFFASNWSGNTAYFYAVAPNNGGTNASGDVTIITSSYAVNSSYIDATIEFKPAQDFATEGEEWFRIEARNSTGTVLATSLNIKIVANNAPSYSFGSIPDPMNEGTSYTVSFTANNIRNTTFTFQTIAATSGTDASGEVTISPTTFTTRGDQDTDSINITITPNTDGIETDEYFRFGAYLGASLATGTGNIRIPGSGTAPSGTFSVSPASHTGASNILGTWNISGNPAPSVRIDSDLGFESVNWGTQGSGELLETNVGQTTTYTLTAINIFGTHTVDSTSTVPTASASISASPSTITSGNSTTLSYTTTNATSASINNGVGNVTTGSGSVSVSPTSTTTYTITPSNISGTGTTASTTVTVEAAPPPPVVTEYNPEVVVIPSTSGASTYGTQAYTNTNFELLLINAGPNMAFAFTGTTNSNATTNSSGSFSFGTYNFANPWTGTWNFTFTNTTTAVVNNQPRTYTINVIAPPAPTAGTMTVTGSNLFNYSGGLVNGNPLTGSSQNQGQHGTTAYINFIVQNGGGTVYYNIDSSSEGSYDFARIQKNGVNQAQRSGLTQNMTGNFVVAASNTVRVEYYKDGSVNGGIDTMTINSLYFVPF